MEPSSSHVRPAPATAAIVGRAGGASCAALLAADTRTSAAASAARESLPVQTR
jgi:hypothetical protein